MPAPIIKGSTGPTLNPLVFRFDPKEGYNSDVSYHGTNAAMHGFSAQLAAAGVGHEYRELQNGFAEIVVSRAPGIGQGGQLEDNTIIDQWEMPGNEIDTDLFMHPNSLAMEADNPGILGFIRKSLKNYNQNTEEDFTFSSSVPGASTLFDLLKTGSTHYKKNQRVLRHRRVVADNFTGDLSYANEGKLYSFDELLEECATFQKPLPQRYVAKIQLIAQTEAPASVAGYAWEWRKSQSTENTAANNKSEVVTEYVLDLWSTYPYTQVV